MVRETRHLWVGNLPETVREDRIREHFKRYGRVQSVRIITSSAYNPTLSTSATDGVSGVDPVFKEHQQLHGPDGETHGGNCSSLLAPAAGDFGDSTSVANPTPSAGPIGSSSVSAAGSAVHSSDISTSSSSSSFCSHSTGSQKPSVPSSNGLVISVCATIAFMDIKSAAKAHTAEHKFDDRILTTEYYEPSLLTMPPTVAPSAVTTGSSNCSTTTPGDNSISTSSTTMHKHTIGNSNNNNNNSSNSINNSGNSIQYSTASATAFLPSSNSGTVSTTAAATNSNNCTNGSISKSEASSGSKLLGHPEEQGSFYEFSNSNGSSRTGSFNRLLGGASGDGEHCSSSSSSIGASGSNGRRMSVSVGYARELLMDSQNGGGNRGRPRDRQHYRNGPYAAPLPERSTPINHHRLSSSSSWYGNTSTNTANDSANNLTISQHQSSGGPVTPTRNIYSAVVLPDHSNPVSASSLSPSPSALQPSNPAAAGLLVNSSAAATNERINNNSYDKLGSKKKLKSRSSDSESPSDGGHHHQSLSQPHHHSSHHSRQTSPISSSHLPHYYHHHHTGGHHHNHIGATGVSGHSSQLTHNSRSDRSNSRSRSRSPSSSCSSTNSTTTSQSNETSSTTRSPATLVLGNSSAPFGSGREGRSDRLDREQICNRGNLQSAVTVSNNSNNNGGSSSGASSSSGSGGGNLNCHSEDNRPLAICVRNLPARSSDTSLKDGLFHEYKKHGKVTWVKVVGQSTDRYALVCFKKPEDVEKALEVSHDKLFFGCKIEVAPYQGYDVDDNEFRPYEAELDEYHPKSTRTLFIGNLEKDITASELRKHFDCFGEIIEIDIKKQGVSAYAFCQYSDIVSVVKAMRKMDGEHLGSNRIKLGFGKSMPTNCVWIDGIADSVGEGYLKSQFDHFGAVSQVTIDRDRKLALVFFEQVQCAQVAVKEMRGATLRGRKLQVDFASRECQDAFFDKLDKQSNASFGSPRFETSSSSRYGNSRYVEGSSRSRAASFSRPSNPLSLGGAVSPRLDPSPVSSSRGNATGNNPSTRSRIVRYSNDDYYLDNANSTHSGGCNERKFRSYDEYSQGSAASSHEDAYEHDGYSSSHTRSSAHDRLQPPTTSDSPPPVVTSSGLSSSIQSRLGDVELPAGLGRKRSEKSPGDIRYLQKERVHILEQLEECPSSGDELVSPKKRIKYNSDAHHGSDPSDHHHPHYSSSAVVIPSNIANDTASGTCDPTAASSGSGNVGGTSGHHHYNSSNSSNHYNSHHHHHHHNSSENSVQSGFSSSSAVSHHRKCVEVRRLSDCNLQQSKSLSSQSTPSSMHSNNNSRRPSTDSTPLQQRHGSSSSNSSSSLQQSHLDSGHPYTHSSKRRKTILNSDNSMTVIASSGISALSSNEHHHSSRGRGHQLHSIHSHEASGGESADGSRPGTPLCDERPENLPPSEPRRIPTSRSYNQEPMSLPLPRFAIQFLQQYRLQNQQQQLQPSLVVPVSSHSSTSVLSSASLQQTSTSTTTTAQFSSVSGSSAQSALSSLHTTSSGAAMSGLSSLSSNSSLLNNTLSSPPPTHATKLSLVIPQNPNSGSSSTTPASASGCSSTVNSLEHGIQAPASPLRAPSVSSNSSDSDDGPSISPSLEERINRLDEMYEKWSGNSQTRPNNTSTDHHFNDRHHSHNMYHHNHISSAVTAGSLNQSPVSNVSSSSTSSFRHKLLELDVHEVPPSDIVKSLLSRKSIFDEDLKRLENISDKYEPGVFTSYAKSTVNFNTTGIANSATVSPVHTILASQSPLHALKAQTPPATSLQRLGSSSTSGSPMNSPQPYNSPNPSVKSGLQYPFPSHPPTMPSVAVTTSVPTSTACAASVTSSAAAGSANSVVSSTNSGTTNTSSTSDASSTFSISSSFPSSLTFTSTSTLASVAPSSYAITPITFSGTTTATGASAAAATTATTTTTLCRSTSATLANKPKTNVLNKSISLTEKASTNISSNNNNNLTCNSNNLTSTSSRCSTSLNESSAMVTTMTTIATTTSIATVKVSSMISSSSSSSSSSSFSSAAVETTVANNTATSTMFGTVPSASSSNITTSNPATIPARIPVSSSSHRSSTVTTAPPGSTNCGTIRPSSIPPVSSSTSIDGLHQHSNSSNTNQGVGNSSSNSSEKEDKQSSVGSGSKHHKDRRKLSTASSCSTSSTGSTTPSLTPTTSSNHPSLPDLKADEASPTDDDHHAHQQHPASGGSSGKHSSNKQNKSNHHHGHNHSHGHSHRHSSDSTSSTGSSTIVAVSRVGPQKDVSDDANEFDRLKLDVPLNNVNPRSGSHSRKEKDVQERDEKEKEKERKPGEERLQREKEESKRNQEQKTKELEEPRRKEKEEDERGLQEERAKQSEREKELERKSPKEREESERVERNKRDKDGDNLVNEQMKHSSDDGGFVSTKTACEELSKHHKGRRDTGSSGGSNSPVRNSSKRRLSSPDSNDSPMEDANALKKHKQENQDNNRISDRRDSSRDGRKEKHHKSHNRTDKASKSSSVSSSSSEKSVSQPNVLGSGGGRHESLDDKQQFMLEERRKEITFPVEEHIHNTHHHKKKDRYHEKHKSKKERESFGDKENTQSENFSVENFADHRSTSDEEELSRLHHKKEHNSSKDYGKRYHSESGVDYKKYDRKFSLAESSPDEDGKKKKNRTNNSRVKSVNSSDTDDSDEPKKHSIFDIPDEGPNISMYDKVKARSCKNMQKQEEEKKIKEKFSKLKRSRAKREGKNRSKSWDEDSDTDGMNSDTTINSKYNHKDRHNKSGMITTSDDDDHLPTTPRIRRQPKEPLASDSEEEEHSRRIRSNRDRLNNLCDDESSDLDHPRRHAPHTPRRRSGEKSSRKNYRSTRIQSDSDSEDNGSVTRHKRVCEFESLNVTRDNNQSHSFGSKLSVMAIKQEIKSEEDNTQEPVESKVEIKAEAKVQPPSALITSDVSDDDVVKSIVKSEIIPSTMIKKELMADRLTFAKERLGQLCDPVSSEGEPNVTTAVSAEIENTVNSAVDQMIYGHSESKKKHKKKQKRHKTLEGSETEVKSEKEHSPRDESGSVFDELKKTTDDQMYASSKKKHSGKKDKRRDRSKEEYERSGKSKKSKNKHKDGIKLPDIVTSNTKREEKMEDIFGPISDEESQHSSVETEVSVKQEPTGQQLEVKSEETTKSLENQPNDGEMTEKEKMKEESRRRKERKRREREKLRAAMTMKEEENSVDLDEAGRALEAQLMSDSDQKADDASPTSTVATSGKQSTADVMDVFRFTDGDDSMETSFSEKKESDHSRKEKKKKKKRGKDEKHKHHHSSSSSSANHTNPPITTPFTPTANKLSLDIISAQQEDSKHNMSKQSPSLPCLMEDSPPCSNRQSALPTSVSIPAGQMSPSTPTGRELACSTPTKELETEKSSINPDDNDALNSAPSKRKLEKTIPAFGEIDQQLHEKAVLSISGEFITEKSTKEDQKIMDVVHETKDKSDESKIEEKSRAVISQEETEDAVAALLGESFGTSNTPDFSIDYSIDPVEESSSQLNNDPPQIPEEDDEEMKKAILSLNTEEHIKLDMKPDTPQSEHDLQIDTDTEDVADDDHPASLLRFDNPPKTPDVDLSQIGKPLSEASTIPGPDSAKKYDKLEMPDTPGKNVQITSSTSAKVAAEATPVSTVITKTSPTVADAPQVGSTVASKHPVPISKPAVPIQAPIIMQCQKTSTATTVGTIKDAPNKVISTIASSSSQPIVVFSSSSQATQVKPVLSVTQKATMVGVQPPQIRQQYIMQAPPTISIPEQHIAYQPLDTAVMSPRGPIANDPRLQSPKLQLQPQSPFMRTSSPTATSPNLIRPQIIPNRQSPQHSPVMGSHPMLIHQPSGHILVSSATSNSQFAPKTSQMNQAMHVGPRFPVVTQSKVVPSPPKVNEPAPSKQPINTFANLGMAPGTRIVTSMSSTASMPVLGNEITSNTGSGSKMVVTSTAIPVTTYVIHNTKSMESGQKPSLPGTPTKTIIHQQPVYIQHPVKQFVPQQQPIIQTNLSSVPQSPRLSSPVATPSSNIIVSSLSQKSKEDSKLSNTTPTITSNPNLLSQSTVASVASTTDNATETSKESKPGIDLQKTSSVAADKTQAPLDDKTASKTDNAMVETKTKPLPESMLTEENVAKIPDNSSAGNVLGIDQEDQEGDSKEDSDYWSSKDTFIDSVIKTLCSEDDVLEATSEQNKDDLSNREDKSEGNDASVSKTQVGELSKADKKSPEPVTKLSTTAPSSTDVQQAPSVVQRNLNPTEVNVNPSTKEENDVDEGSSESVIPEASTRGGKRGGRRGGRKTSESMPSTIKQTTVPDKAPEPEVTTVSRRGAKAGIKRGRGGARGGSSRGVTTNVHPAMPSDGKGKSSNSGSDVYEFHDDSGEEVVAGDNQQTDGTRPRLILTIKNQTPSTVATSTVGAAPAPVTTSTTVASSVTNVTASTISTVQMQPTTSCPAPQPPVETQSIPSPASETSREEFVHPSANTRKSRRLLEKDGRTTVDDIIDDVIRNGPSPRVTPPPARPQQQQQQQSQPAVVLAQSPFLPQQPVHAPSVGSLGTMGQSQQPPQTVTGELPSQPGRRNTRNNATAANAAADARKSPRAGRKGKDRKISETSADSNDEKSMAPVKLTQMDAKIDGKSMAGTLSATTPITPSVSVSRPNETASVADKAKDKPKSADEVKTELGTPQANSLTLIDPVTGELTVMRTGKEGQYVAMPNAPQPLKKVIAAAANAQNAAEQLKTTTSSPTPPLSASASPIPNRTPTPGLAPSPGLTRVPTPNTTVAHHPTQQLEAQKLSSVMAKQSSPLPLTSQSPTIPATTVVIPSPHSTGGTVVIQHPQSAQQHSIQKPHTLKAHVLNSQQIIQQQQQSQQQSHPGKTFQQAAPSTQTQIVYKSVIPQQQLGAIHTTTGKQIHPGTNIKMSSQTIPQGIHAQSTPQQQQQQIIIQNPISQQPMTINKQTIINKQPQQQQQSHQSAIHHPPGSGNLLINIPQNMHQLGNVPMSPRMPQHHQVVISNTKPHPGQPIQGQTQHSPQIIHKQVPGQPQQTQHQNQPAPQQIIIHSGKIPPGQQQIPSGYTTVLQSGGKIIHQGPIQMATQQQQLGQGTLQQQQQQTIGVPGKHTTQTIQISGTGGPGGGIPIHYQSQSGGPQPTIVHKTITTVHGGQQIKIQQQHKVGPDTLSHLQPGTQIGGKQIVQQVVTSAVGGKLPPQQLIHQQQLGPNQSVGLGKVNHVVSVPPTSSGCQQPPQPSQLLTIQQGKSVPSSHLHQAPQILTGAVASPPLKQPHMQSQQPIVTGASSTRVAMPPVSPQGQQPSTTPHLRHVQQPGMNAPSQVAYETNPHGDLAGFIARGQSPPPAHQQQTSPITPNDATFRGGMPRDYVKYMYNRSNIHIPSSRSPMLPGSVEQRELPEMEESAAASPPLELRRPSSGPRPITTAVPHSLQSPGDRSTDSPQVAQVYIGSARIPHTYSDSLNTRFYDPAAVGGPNAPPRALSAEPPPAHRPHNLTTAGGGFPPGSYPGTPSQTPPPPSPANLSQIQQQSQQQQQQQLQQRDLQQQRDRVTVQGHTQTTPISAGPLPAHAGGIPAVLSQQPQVTGRGNQIATPPIGAQSTAPTQSDSLEALLQRYPVMWQGLLALKNDQAAVQMHFVHGNPGVAGSSLPSNSDGTTPPLRIAQRMRLEPAQIDGVARKMQMDQEHCMLLALPCGRDRMDVLQQQNNLQTGFITYLQQKQAAGIVNIAAPGSSQAAYVVHIFPSCEFANENLARIAPDLMHRVANIQYLLIVIATV
ncbi:protein split ends isoform X3 [Malaya genurostris]|uniref:protein split ends isoform X3 n=1 Tax=Malaya genurostris TaxID=325434 RepID=UPI0026F3F050|nr:protein split ends isoform X3 [Malaya genurostris]